MLMSCCAAGEQQGGDAVDDDADGGDDHDHAALRSASGWTRRRIASAPIAPTATSRNKALSKRGEDRCFLEAVGEARRRSASRHAPRRAQATTRPSTSDRLCPASASSAIELARKPKIVSTMTKPRLSAMPMAKARLKSAGRARWSWCDGRRSWPEP